MKCFSKTDIGLVRSENQDRVWTGTLDEDAVAIILCDGMGGENAGSVASQMTIDFMSDRIRKGFRSNINRNYIRNLLITSVTAANSLVYDKAMNETDKYGMGTTCVAGIIYNNRAYIINVGDSRAYLIFDDSMSALDVTTDSKLQRALREHFDDTTVIMIAQRIASVQDADRIIVMEDGRIAAFDTHEMLLETSDIYREVYESQVKGSEDE